MVKDIDIKICGNILGKNILKYVYLVVRILVYLRIVNL